MSKRCVIPVLVMATIMATGCGDDKKWHGKNCSAAGETTVCIIHKKDGTTCETVRDDTGWGATTTTDCDKPSDGMTCNDEYNNTSGNICKVDMGNGVVCVAVLPDGGKAPKDYKDFVTCPDGADQADEYKENK